MSVKSRREAGDRRFAKRAMTPVAIAMTIALLASVLSAIAAPAAIAAPTSPSVAASQSTQTASGAQAAASAVGSDFDPGYIVSDENFYDGTTMTAAAVQSFILSKNSRCNSTFACLWGYGQNTPSTNASNYCAAIPAMSSASAALIIQQVGSACNISQRAILVLLEKEQGLVTGVSPTRRSFEAATGFNCPDTAPCDPNYAGFFYQVYNAARQFQIYKAFPGSFNHRANATNNILYNPIRACGASPVFIRNAATAGLYNYTPYQPNAAALANMYTVGDGCSSYGNRNFWRMWTDWFGSPTEGGYDLIRLAGTNNTYLVFGNQRYAFLSQEMLAQYTVLGDIREVSVATFYAKWLDSVQVQRALRSTDGAIYLIDNNKRYRFSTCAQVQDFGQACDTIPTVSVNQVNKIPDGGWVSSLVGMADGTAWFMQGGQRRLVPDPAVLAPYGISPTPTRLSYHATAANPIGAPVLKTGLYTDGQNHFRTATGAGQYDVTAAAVASGLTAPATTIDPYSFAAMVPTAQLPLRLLSDGRYFVASAGGWLEVDGSVYGGASVFTALPSGAWQGVSVVGTERRPHFARERSSSQVYLVSGGLRSPVANQAEIDSISANYGVPKKVWIVADAALDGVGERSSLVTGTLVRAAGSSTTYLVDSGRLVVVPRTDYIPQLGLKTAVQTVSASVINGFADKSTVLDRTIVNCAGRDYLGSNGGRHPFVGSVDGAWNMPGVALSDATCALIPLRAQGVGRYLIGPDGRHWYVSDGAHLRILDGTARSVLAGLHAPVAVSNEAAGQLAGGLDITSGAQQGSLVMSNRGVVYVVNGDVLTQMTRWDTASVLGLGNYSTTIRVDDGFIAAFSVSEIVLDRPAVRCGNATYIGVAGQLRTFTEPNVTGSWHLTPIVLADAACARLTISDEKVTRFFRTPDGTVWSVAWGERSAVYGWPAMDRLGVIATGFTDVSYEVAGMLPVGVPITS